MLNNWLLTAEEAAELCESDKELLGFDCSTENCVELLLKPMVDESRITENDRVFLLSELCVAPL